MFQRIGDERGFCKMKDDDSRKKKIQEEREKVTFSTEFPLLEDNRVIVYKINCKKPCTSNIIFIRTQEKRQTGIFSILEKR